MKTATQSIMAKNPEPTQALSLAEQLIPYLPVEWSPFYFSGVLFHQVTGHGNMYYWWEEETDTDKDVHLIKWLTDKLQAYSEELEIIAGEDHWRVSAMSNDGEEGEYKTVWGEGPTQTTALIEAFLRYKDHINRKKAG